MSKHVALWIDQARARILHLHGPRTDEIILTSPRRILHDHELQVQKDRDRYRDTRRFFHEVTRTLRGARSLLVVGPPTTRKDFRRYVCKHDRSLGQRLVDLETEVPASNQQFIVYAKKHFHGDELMV